MTLQTTALAGAALAALAFGATITSGNGNLVVHEWGTFTSVAGETGQAVEWATLENTPDLPCFVERLSPRNIKSANALVRMETPVLYFYPEHEMTVSVHVAFPQGWITEWYPHASEVQPKQSNAPMILAYNGGKISWDGIRVTPGPDPHYPVGRGASRYYAARQTDSAPLTVAGQQEKMIFYRGIANFPIPLSASFDGDGMLNVRHTGGEPLPMALLFENRDGRAGYRKLDFAVASKIKPAELTSSVEEMKGAVRAGLERSGLFAKEAAAMIETWQDSWFEPGTRLIYIVPRKMVDRVLPLNISPAASRVERVFVGRIELMSPSLRTSIETALATGQNGTLEKLGRFLEPFVDQIARTNPGLLESRAAQSTLQTARTKVWRGFEAKCIP